MAAKRVSRSSGGRRGRGGGHDLAHRPRPAFATGTLIPTLAALGLGIASIRYLDVLAHAIVHQASTMVDWHTLYRAAGEVRAGAWAELYAEGRRLVAVNDYDYWRTSNASGHGQYVYPPLLAFLLVPVTWLGTGAAAVLWLLALTFALGGFCWAVLRALRRPVRLDTGAVVAIPALAGVSAGPLSSIVFGQIDTLLLLLLTLALLAYTRRRDTLAGVALGLAACVKPTLAFCGLYFVRKRRWAALGAAALTWLIAGLGPFALLGRGALRDWLIVNRYFASGDYVAYPGNMSLYGLLRRVFTGGPFNGALVPYPTLADVIWAGTALGALGLWWRCVSSRPVRGRRAAAEYGLTIATMLFVSPLSWYNHYMVLLVPLAVLADTAAWRPPSRGWAALAIGACLYFALPWLFTVADRLDATDLQRVAGASTYLYGLGLVGIALAALLRRYDHLRLRLPGARRAVPPSRSAAFDRRAAGRGSPTV